ncbi:MAG: SDR family NAD(P)-dependent oxidoreductase, partial [Spirochaetes bacterium]|nr:SDR family NAD(P)-dependent oxidoreductase [Spirochaetota bacterium]
MIIDPKNKIGLYMQDTALITGGAKRIGKNIAIKLATLGYNIALHYNSSYENAKKVKLDIENQGVICELFKCDLSNENDTLLLIQTVTKKFANLNLLVNNASIFNKAALLDTEIDLFNNTFNINFKAPYILSRDFAKLVDKGHIINIIDTKVSGNSFLYSAYNLSKKSLANFTLMAANELGPNIRVNGISPGLILAPEDKTEKYLNNMAINIPLKKK